MTVRELRALLDRWIELLESTGASELRRTADPGHWLTPEAAQVLREMRLTRDSTD